MPEGVSRPTRPRGFDEAQGAFDEEGIEVDVAAAKQGIVAGGADDLAQTVGAGLGLVEGLGQRIVPARAGV